MAPRRLTWMHGPALGTGGFPLVGHVHPNETKIPSRRPRRHSRASVSWAVVVKAGRRVFLLQAVNVSGRGAKVRPTERLSEGQVAWLHFHRPNGASFDVEAIVWRVDRDGLACLFTEDHQRRLTRLLAPVTGASPVLWSAALVRQHRDCWGTARAVPRWPAA